MTALTPWAVAPARDFGAQVVTIEVAHQIMKNNNYLVVDPLSGDALLVDPAWQIDKIEAALLQARARPRGILITHSHFDHIHLAKPLAERYACPIWMSRREIEFSGFAHERLIPIDETPWRIGGLTVEPIATPGHTPGCVCFLIDGHLFSGDVLFAEGCGICRDVESAHAMFDSLERLKRRLTPDTRIYPGHTYVRPPGQSFADVLRCNMYLQFKDPHSFAAYRLRQGQNKLLDFR